MMQKSSLKHEVSRREGKIECIVRGNKDFEVASEAI